MSTVAVARKNGQVAMASDTVSSQGSTRCPASHKNNNSKILRIGNSLVGSVGSTAHLLVLSSLSTHHPGCFDFSSAHSIFESFRKIHKVLVEEYHLLTRENDEEQPYESTQMNLMIASPTGIFEVQGYREVIDYSRFWATGSGYKFALGSMETSFDQEALSAGDIVERAVSVACLFDEASGTPVELETIAVSER